jgi:hypothetical protein
MSNYQDPLTNWLERLRYRGPEILTDDVQVVKFEVRADSLESLRIAFQGRACKPGIYHKLIVDNTLWMSDTTAECRDHVIPVIEAGMRSGGTGLINGLGMGCVLGAWLDVLTHVDVVESDQRIIDTVGAWYEKEYPGQVTIHHADAYEVTWPKDAKWDVAWHDIWPTISDENLPDMERLRRKYSRRVKWQGSWAIEDCRWMRKQWKRMEASFR